MAIIRRTKVFTSLLRIFQRKVSSGTMSHLLAPIDVGDEIFGDLNSLTSSFHSEICRIMDYQDKCESEDEESQNPSDYHGGSESKEKKSPEWLEDARMIMKDCLMESALHQYPEAMMCSRVEIRAGYTLVTPKTAYCLTHALVEDKTIFDFFAILSEIMNNHTVFPDETYGDVDIKGHSVGKITATIVKQLALFHRKMTISYSQEVGEHPDVTSARFAKEPHWKYIANTFRVERMNGQLQIITRILDAAIKFQGFNFELSRELTGDQEEFPLIISPNWEIVLDI